MRIGLKGLAILLLAGCGGEYKFAPVSGRLTLNGKPLTDAWVNFQPFGSKDPGPGSVGKIDQDGRYALRVAASRSGAVVGKHRVSISTRGDRAEADPDAGGPRYKDEVPLRYNCETQLTCQVPPTGRTDADFELQAP